MTRPELFFGIINLAANHWRLPANSDSKIALPTASSLPARPAAPESPSSSWRVQEPQPPTPCYAPHGPLCPRCPPGPTAPTSPASPSHPRARATFSFGLLTPGHGCDITTLHSACVLQTSAPAPRSGRRRGAHRRASTCRRQGGGDRDEARPERLRFTRVSGPSAGRGRRRGRRRGVLNGAAPSFRLSA